MVRPESDPPLGWLSCVELAGESPASVSAGAPSSRLRVGRETNTPERSVESPLVAVRLRGGEQSRGPNANQLCSVNRAAS
jgi:hypothetical protein